MQLAVAATPDVALPTLDALLASDHSLVRVITRADRPAGRGRGLRASKVSDWALAHGIPCEKPTDKNDLAHSLREIDVLLTIGYGVILPQDLLEIPRICSINLHFSLLPRWRGAAPVQRAIEAGDSVSGVTVFQLDEGMDTGPIFVTKRFALDSDISADELLHELSLLGPEAIFETLEKIEKDIQPTPQPQIDATHAAKLSKAEAEISWQESAIVLERKIRAMTSVPGAWTKFRGHTVILAHPHHSDVHLSPGEIQVIEKKLHVGTATTALVVDKIKPSGKSLMGTIDWFNGVRLQPGESFGG